MKPRPNPIYALEKYFTTGTAEAEGNILADAFVPLRDYLEIINPPHASPRLLVGKKGSGKSAFIRVLKKRMDDVHVPTLILKPEDVDMKDVAATSSIGEITKCAVAALISAIASHIGSELSGLLTDEEQVILAKHAEHVGMRKPDGVQKALHFLAPIGSKVSGIDFEKMAKSFGSGSVEEVKRAVVQSVEKDGKVFYLLFDDTDQIASPSEPTHLNRIWGFLLAARSVSQQCPNLRCIVTLRTEVWLRLQRDDAGQRDQVDHFRSLALQLNPGEDDVGKIIERRLRLAADEMEINSANVFEPFFDGASVAIPTSSETRSWKDFIVKRSRERPRDAVQLIALLLKAARKGNSEKVNNHHVATTMVQYSEERVDDLRREMDDECKQIKEIIRSFAGIAYDSGPFTLSADSMLKHLRGLPSRFGITLLGTLLKPGDEDCTFRLWKFLFDAGFMGARRDDSTKAKGFTHIGPRDDLDLIAKPRWNDIQKYKWEINPAYRDFLIAVKKHDNLGISFPVKRSQR